MMRIIRHIRGGRSNVGGSGSQRCPMGHDPVRFANCATLLLTEKPSNDLDAGPGYSAYPSNGRDTLQNQPSKGPNMLPSPEARFGIRG